MQFDDTEAEHLKSWVIKKLENNSDSSDADPDVLADYVLALVKTDGPEDQVRAACVENLEDFLRDGEQARRAIDTRKSLSATMEQKLTLTKATGNFVNDLFDAIHKRSFIPGHAALAPNQELAGQVPFQPPTGPAADTSGRNHNQNNYGQAQFGGNQSRKRTFHNRDNSDPTSQQQFPPGDRAKKQMRRSGPMDRGGRHHHQPFGHQNIAGAGMQMQNPQVMPQMPPGFPPLDPNNPMAAVMAMQAMGFPAMPGFPPFPNAGSPLQGQSSSPTGFGQQGRRTSFGQTPQKSGMRCPDYDNKGFCAAGANCPHEHGEDSLVMPGGPTEYDPQNSSIMTENTTPSNKRNNDTRSTRGGRGGGRGGRGDFRGGRGQRRAQFSSPAPNHDRSNTSVVVENIPDEKFATEEIQSFFSEFGPIEDVNMDEQKRLAIVKFKDYESANRAYDSPKVIFDNRFVKVYWYKPEGQGRGNAPHAKQAYNPKPSEDEDMPDLEEFEKRQAEAQRAYEEKQKKQQEAAAQKEELDRRIKAQAEERRQLLEKLATKTGTSTEQSNANGTTAEPAQSPPNGTGAAAAAAAAASPPTTTPASTNENKDNPTQTDILRNKLAALESQAETMGLPSSPSDDASGFGRGARGGRGVPFFARGRGRGYNPYRGGGARGGWWNGGAGGAVARLDNRPKGVRVTAADQGVDFGDEKTREALNAHLHLNVGEYADVTVPAPEEGEASAAGAGAGAGTALVTFKERYVAEIFVAKPFIEGVGKVEFAWAGSKPAVPAAAAAGVTATATATEVPVEAKSGEVADVKEGEAAAEEGEAVNGGAAGGRTDVDWDVADDDDRWMR